MSESASEEIAKPLTVDVIRALVESRREFVRFVESRVRSAAVAEDIVQDAFARGITKVDSLRDDGAAIGWFYRSLRNAVVDHQRRGRVADGALASFAAELTTHEAPQVEVRSAICRCVTRIAETLKPEYAEALTRSEVDGISVTQFAKDRGITAGNAAVRVHRAREALRTRVRESCGACADHGCLDCTCEHAAV